MSNNSDDFFGGNASLSWSRQDNMGEWVDVPELLNVVRGGQVLAVSDQVPLLDYTTKQPKLWPDGQPMKKVIITMRCDGSGQGVDERDHSDPADLGDRQLHITSGDQRQAIGEACRKVGLRGVRVGGELYLAWTGKRPNKSGKGRPARTWSALFVPGVTVVDSATGGSPFAQQPANPIIIHGNGPQAGQPVSVGHGPGAAPVSGAPVVPQPGDPQYAAYQAWLAQQQPAQAPVAAAPSAPPASPFAPAPQAPPATAVPPWQVGPAAPATRPPWEQ